MRYPDRLNCVVELLDKTVAAGHGERAAIRSPAGVLTYAALLALVNRIAHVLREDLGLVPGNRVLLRGPNNPMMAACWLAVVKAGCIAVATMPLLRAKELKPVIDKAQCNAALCDVNLREEMELVRAQCPVLGANALLQHRCARLSRRARGLQAVRSSRPRRRQRTTSASSPSPPAPPVCPRAPCTSTAT